MQELDALTVPLRGLHVIEASAGTGKTYTMATLVLRLLLERNLGIEQLLVVTFTRAAAAELRSRIWRRLSEALRAFEGERTDAPESTLDPTLKGLLAKRGPAERVHDAQRLRVALRDFDEASISTIHGFCQRILHQHAFDTGTSFDAEIVVDDREILRELVEDYWARFTHDANEVFVDFITKRYDSKSNTSPDPRSKLGDLMALARKVATFRRVPVVPERGADPGALENHLAEWKSAHRVLCERWEADAEEVARLLLRTDLLQQRIYGPKKGPDLVRFTQCLTQARPCLRWIFPHFERLTTSRLEVNCRSGKTWPPHPFFAACDRLWEAESAVEQALFEHALAFRIELIANLNENLDRRKRRTGRMTYDDLLHGLHDAVGSSSTLRRRLGAEFPAVLIDEFQDTDPVQYRIFRQIHDEAPGSTLFLIGDPKQAIYGFRGADVQAYLGAVRDAGANVHTLQTNYRSDPRLVQVLDQLWRRPALPFAFPEIQVAPVRAAERAEDCLGGPPEQVVPFRIRLLDDSVLGPVQKRKSKPTVDLALARGLAAEVAATLGSGLTIDGRPVKPADIAILTRTNRQAAQMQDALRNLSIPAVLFTEASVFDTREADELDAVLQAMGDPADLGAVRSALITSLLGFSGPDLALLEADEEGWERQLEAFRGWNEVWKRHGFIPAFRRLMTARGVQRRLLELTDGERRITNINHLIELVHQVSFARHMGPTATVAWMAAMRQDEIFRHEQVGETAQLRLESDEEAVKLVTIHKSKGLEYPLVFCTHLWDGMRGHREDPLVLFHDEDDGNQLKLDLGSDDRDAHVARARVEAMAENMRLIYVALTRAKHRVDVVWGAFKDAQESALGRLLHGPEPVEIPKEAPRIRAFEAAEVALHEDLKERVDAAEGLISIEPLAASAPALARDNLARLPEQARARIQTRTIIQSWSVSSFSRLLRHSVADRIDGPEHDSVVDPLVSVQVSLPDPSDQQVPLSDFPAGARAGDFFHGVLEDHDFTAGADALAEVIRARLTRHGFTAETWEASVAQGLLRLLPMPLWEGGPALDRISRSHRIDEMEFVLPVHAAAPGESGFSARSVGSLIERHGSPASRAYVEQLARLGFSSLVGYLRGFIDLMFEWEGRYYVVDYKSNMLGGRWVDYESSALTRAMIQHHYVLQSHLYCLAVHRHLAARVKDYDYERHFGGSLYLFLRGMDVTQAPGHGVHFDRPSVRLIDGLTGLLDVGVVREDP